MSQKNRKNTNNSGNSKKKRRNKIRRNRKDRLFIYIFGNPNNKKWLLSIYNAIRGSDYTNPDDIEILDFEHDELHEEDGLDFYDYATEFYKRDNSMYQDFYDTPNSQIENTLYYFMQDEDLTQEEKYVKPIIEINNQKEHEEKARKTKS